MHMTCEVAQELITGLVDGQLREAERAALESHFKVCTKCRFAFAQEQNLKQAIHHAGDELRATAALRESLLGDARIFGSSPSRPKRWNWRQWRPQPNLRPAWIAALVLLLAVPAWFLTRPADQPIAIAAVQNFSRLAAGESLTVKSKDLGELVEALSRAIDGRFRPMGYDFAMMRIHPAGGSVQMFNGRPVLVTRYLGPYQTILCYTFIGSDADAPSTSAPFYESEKRFHFYAFSVGNVNAVLHREDDIICILASPMAMPELLELARAKAKPHKHI